jgi:hypothetical protein
MTFSVSWLEDINADHEFSSTNDCNIYLSLLLYIILDLFYRYIDDVYLLSFINRKSDG